MSVIDTQKPTSFQLLPTPFNTPGILTLDDTSGRPLIIPAEGSSRLITCSERSGVSHLDLEKRVPIEAHLAQPLVVQPHLPVPVRDDRFNGLTLPDLCVQVLQRRSRSVIFRVLEEGDERTRSDERIGGDLSEEFASRDLS
jgi:hypothetical protein